MPISSDDYVFFTCEFLYATPKAIQVHKDGGEHFWIPRSVISGWDDKKVDSWQQGDLVTFEVRRWLLDSKREEGVIE